MPCQTPKPGLAGAGNRLRETDPLLGNNANTVPSQVAQTRQRPVALAPRITDSDRKEHRALVATLPNAIWNDYLPAESQPAAADSDER
jgi:hypothetical protein